MKRILVLREPDEFSRILSENGFEIINLPTIETKPLEDLSDFDAKLETIENYAGIFITSKIAAQILAQKIDESNINFAGKVYVLGKRSFEILQSKDLNLVFFEDANTAAEMLEKISPGELKNKYFLFVRGEKSLETIPSFLADFAFCDESVVYRNQMIHPGLDTILEISELFEASEIEAICFFSPSGAESFFRKFGTENWQTAKVAAIGKTTADFFEKQSLQVDFVSPKATAKDFAVELINYLKEGLPAKYTKQTKKREMQ